MRDKKKKYYIRAAHSQGILKYWTSLTYIEWGYSNFIGGFVGESTGTGTSMKWAVYCFFFSFCLFLYIFNVLNFSYITLDVLYCGFFFSIKCFSLSASSHLALLSDFLESEMFPFWFILLVVWNEDEVKWLAVSISSLNPVLLKGLAFWDFFGKGSFIQKSYVEGFYF